MTGRGDHHEHQQCGTRQAVQPRFQGSACTAFAAAAPRATSLSALAHSVAVARCRKTIGLKERVNTLSLLFLSPCQPSAGAFSLEKCQAGETLSKASAPGLHHHAHSHTTPDDSVAVDNTHSQQAIKHTTQKASTLCQAGQLADSQQHTSTGGCICCAQAVQQRNCCMSLVQLRACWLSGMWAQPNT